MKSEESGNTSISIGVVTHQRSAAFAKMLVALKASVEKYKDTCELIVANNSGSVEHAAVAAVVDDSAIRDSCNVRIIDSPENSISVGRNIVLDHARYQHIAFIDDDEYPVESWLVDLLNISRVYDCEVVAGPILPIFLPGTAKWIANTDLHNTQKLKTGDTIDYAASGNFLFNREGVEDIRFRHEFGKSGGEDTDYFLQLKDRNHTMCWSESSIVFEDIPADKATAGYMIRRFMTQGRNYRNILEQRNELGNRWIFLTRAFVQASIGLCIGGLFLILRPDNAGYWLKAGFANLGKVIDPKLSLYG